MDYLDKLKQKLLPSDNNKVPVPEIDWEAVSRTSPIEGTDTDSPIIANTDTDKSAYQQATELKPSLEGREQLDNISKPKEETENKWLKAAKSFGDNLQRNVKPVSSPQLGSVQQALGQSTDVLDAKRKALLKMMGR